MDDDDIIGALRRNDPAGAKELVKAYGQRLLRSAFLLCESETDAQDLVQDTLIQAVRSIQYFAGNSKLYTWLHGILLNMSRSYRRKVSRMPFTYRFPTSQTLVPPDSAPLDMDKDSSELAQAVQHLSPAYRDIVILRFFEGLKLEDISQRLNIPLSTVKTRLTRALRGLRRNIKE